MTTTAHGHRHGRTCYWDHTTCGWVCAAPPPEAATPEVPDRAEPEVAPEPQPA